MELYNNKTEHTTSNSNVYLDGNKMWQQTDEYRDIANNNQLAAIVEDLTLNKGFLIEKERNKVFKLSNPTDTETSYWIFVDELGINKRTVRLIGTVNM